MADLWCLSACQHSGLLSLSVSPVLVIHFRVRASILAPSTFSPPLTALQLPGFPLSATHCLTSLLSLICSCSSFLCVSLSLSAVLLHLTVFLCSPSPLFTSLAQRAPAKPCRCIHESLLTRVLKAQFAGKDSVYFLYLLWIPPEASGCSFSIYPQ